MPIDDRAQPLRGTLLAGCIAALVKLALALPFLGRYGWDRDELYFLQASRHLAPGYVDFPPMTALVGRVVLETFGSSLVALRLTGVLAGMFTIVLVALCVRELGGGFRSQLLGSLAFVLTPFGLGLGVLFHPTMLDVPIWAGFSYVALRILGRPEPRLLPLLGLIAGIGLETKVTVVALLAVFTGSLAAFGPRSLFRDRRTWLGAGIAVACTLPYLGWQVAHGWPSLEFLGSQASKTAEDTSQLAYLGQQLAFLGGALALVAVGIVTLWRRPQLRALAVTSPGVSLVYLLEQGRSYYALPAVALPLAAGVVTAGRRLRGSRARIAIVVPVVALHVVALALVAPLVWPVLPERTMVERGIWNDGFYKDEIGWPELVRQTAGAWRAIPAAERRATALLAQNYGEAGALALYGPRNGIPRPLSGHLSFQYWRPASLPQRRVLAVGFGGSELDRLCLSWRVVARIDNRWHIGNEERGRPIARCTLRGRLGDLWSEQIASNRL
jgi:4-amino-4-deoxy-L-arabinose transferase-like glycosyltransferase